MGRRVNCEKCWQQSDDFALVVHEWGRGTLFVQGSGDATPNTFCVIMFAHVTNATRACGCKRMTANEMTKRVRDLNPSLNPPPPPVPFSWTLRHQVGAALMDVAPQYVLGRYVFARCAHSEFPLDLR